MFFLLYFKKVKFGLNRKYIRESLLYCLPIIPVDGIGLISSLVDRYFILKYISLAAVGVYFVGYQISMIVSLVALAINSAYTPIFFGKYESEDNNFEPIYRMGEYIVYFTSFLALIISVLSPNFIAFMFNEEYQSVEGVIVYLTFIGSIKSVYFLNTNVLSLEPRLVKYKTVGIVIGTIVTTALGFIMTKTLGLVGAAISTMLGFFITTLILISIVRKNTNFLFNNFKSMSFIIALFILALLCQELDSWIYKTFALIFGTIIALILFEKEYFKRVVNKYATIEK